VEKPLFSITCATCQARLAVRSEAAIGAILECPKCHSMVQVTPPPGWTPPVPLPPAAGEQEPAEPSQIVSPVGDAAVSQATAIEPAGHSPWRIMLQTWMLWGGVPLVTLVAIISVLWALLAPPTSEPTATDVEQAAQAPEKPKTDQTATAPSPDAKSAGQEKPAEKKAKKKAANAEAKNTAAKPGTKAKSEPKATAKQSDTPQKPKPSSSEAVPAKSPAEPSEEKSPTAAKSDSSGAERVAASEGKKEAKDEEKVEIKKTPAPTVDVAARCADPVAALELTDVPLAKAVDLLAGMSTLPITIDVDTLEQLGISLRDPVSLQVGSTTIAKSLQAIAAQKGLAFTAEGGQVLLSAPAKYRETLQKVRYAVTDLTGDDKTATSDLAALLQDFVAPDSWQAAGSRGTIKADPGAIEITQTGDVHDQVLVFLEKLRTARGKPLQTHDRTERFALATRWDRARKMLEQRLTVNYHDPAPLSKILAFLAGAAHCDIVVDRAALAAADTSDRVETTVTVVKQPLDKTLIALLQPLGLVYRTVGARTIQITTKEAADERWEVEFYPLGALAAGKKNDIGRQVIDELKSKAGTIAWNAGGNLYFDVPSQCLIVLQPQTVQIAVERLLREKEAKRKEKEVGKGK